MQRHYINTRMKTLRVLFFAIVPLFSPLFRVVPSRDVDKPHLTPAASSYKKPRSILGFTANTAA
jgi:hypothetical protein